MQSPVLLLVLLGVMALAYRFGYKRAVSVAGGVERIKTLHSLPGYYGFYAALWAGLPALLLLGFWVGFQDTVVTGLVAAALPTEVTAGLSAGQLDLLRNDIENLATENIVSVEVTPALQAAADHYARLRGLAHLAMWSLVLAVALGDSPSPAGGSTPGSGPATAWSLP